MVDGMRERLRSRAASPGKIRELAVTLFMKAKSEPPRAESMLSAAARQARSLQSRDRRFLFDGLYEIIRYESRLKERLKTSDPLALWLGWLVHDGYDPVRAREHYLEVNPSMTGPPFEEAQLLSEPTSLPVYAGLHPEIASPLLDRYGDAIWNWVDASNERAPVTLRANLKKTSPGELAKRLASEGIPTHPGEWCEESLHVEGRHNLVGMRSFRDGWFEIQDEGSLLLSKLVPSEGRGLDLCAGAGGKTLAIAAEYEGSILATDIREAPLNELLRRAQRAGVQVQTRLLPRDGSWPPHLAERTFDWVLVDAPCTGLGVLRRHPVHRWMVDPERLNTLTATQDLLLDRAASVTSPGGFLIYGTCSPMPAENHERIQAFLDRTPGWQIVPASGPPSCLEGSFLCCEPHVHHTDGFFGAKLQRVDP